MGQNDKTKPLNLPVMHICIINEFMHISNYVNIQIRIVGKLLSTCTAQFPREVILYVI